MKWHRLALGEIKEGGKTAIVNMRFLFKRSLTGLDSADFWLLVLIKR